MTETREQKAQRLVDEGRVQIIGQSWYGTYAIVEGDIAHHTIKLSRDGRFYCSCAWGRTHSYTADLCAHALAVKLSAERDIPKEETCNKS